MPRRKSEKDVEFDVQVGARIEAARKRREMTAKRLAATVGITQSQLYFYEAGTCSCPVRTLNLIADALGAAVTSLMPNTSCSRKPEIASCASANRC